MRFVRCAIVAISQQPKGWVFRRIIEGFELGGVVATDSRPPCDTITTAAKT